MLFLLAKSRCRVPFSAASAVGLLFFFFLGRSSVCVCVCVPSLLSCSTPPSRSQPVDGSSKTTTTKTTRTRTNVACANFSHVRCWLSGAPENSSFPMATTRPVVLVWKLKRQKKNNNNNKFKWGKYFCFSDRWLASYTDQSGEILCGPNC